MPRSSRESMKKNMFKKHHEDKMFDSLTLETINTIYNKLEESTTEKHTTLLVGRPPTKGTPHLLP